MFMQTESNFFFVRKDCQLSKKGTLCAEPDPTISPCLSAGHCDGKSPVCPGPLPASELGRRCHEHGHCLNGVCLPFCSRLGLHTCICDKGSFVLFYLATHCHILFFYCVRYEMNHATVVNTSELVTMHLENNRPCAVGFCRSGICVESKTQRLGRLWPLFLSTEAWSRYFVLSGS
ncbi:unnamed protein product [Hydatigera taeniaeformis]|uniref:EB domain-containing protein n=1 Tax=Hydatigena taeniaeformis TaxID=6205 RepID=A0A0R3WU20_HYDTA|nr:unnamed protein product [Hydatigera taeniaeformis]